VLEEGGESLSKTKQYHAFLEMPSNIQNALPHSPWRSEVRWVNYDK